MIDTHFFAFLPLIILLIVSLVFYGKGLVHLLTFSYAMVLGYFAALNQWEILFMPIVAITVIISILLFTYAMARGNWL